MLSVRSLAAGYQKKAVIQDINVDFKPGSITAILGPNGSGKSTLLKSIVDLCEVYDGEVLVSGKSRNELGAQEFARHISYLPQTHTGGSISVSRMVLHGRFPHLSYPRRYRKVDYAYCHEAMKQTGILDLKHRNVGELSGGQRQKVYLAMALAGDMEILLLDEPTTHLDLRYQLELLDTITWLRDRNKTVVAVLHDIGYALEIANQIIVMNQGKLVFQGTPDELVKSGIINEVFQVSVKTAFDENGKRYLHFDL